MTTLTEERATTEERVSYLEGSYAHMPTKADVFEVEKQLSDRIDDARTEFRAGLDDARTEFRTELAKLRAEIRTETTDLREKIAELRAEMQTGFAELRAEMRAGFAELRAEIAEGGDRMVKWLIAIAAVGVVVFAVATTVLIRIFG